MARPYSLFCGASRTGQRYLAAILPTGQPLTVIVAGPQSGQSATQARKARSRIANGQTIVLLRDRNAEHAWGGDSDARPGDSAAQTSDDSHRDLTARGRQVRAWRGLDLGHSGRTDGRALDETRTVAEVARAIRKPRHVAKGQIWQHTPVPLPRRRVTGRSRRSA
jgi:hypothetical protein